MMAFMKEERRIGLRGARCVTVMPVCSHHGVTRSERRNVKPRRQTSLINGIYSVGYFPNGFWQRRLMPLIGPVQELALFVAIPLVGLVDNLVVASFALHQVLVPKPAPARLQCTFEL